MWVLLTLCKSDFLCNGNLEPVSLNYGVFTEVTNIQITTIKIEIKDKLESQVSYEGI